MTRGRAISARAFGIRAHLVDVEAEVNRGLASVTVSGSAESDLRTSRDRVRAALVNSGSAWPDDKVLITVLPSAPSPVPEANDLAMAVAVLAASGSVPTTRLTGTVLLAGLSIDGRLRPVRGILPGVLAARNAGFATVVVPHACMPEAALVDRIEVLGAENLRAVIGWLRGQHPLSHPAAAAPAILETDCRGGDLDEVAGHHQACQALEVAAVGGHSLRLIGPPGVGKLMLGQRLPGLLPPLTEAESLEVAAIASMAGLLNDRHDPRTCHRPYVAAHHSSSVDSLLGSAVSGRPGAVPRAHLGVLHLDHYPELPARTLDALRTVLDDGEVRLANRDRVVRFPAQVQVILSALPCPCAATRSGACICSPATLRRYHGRLAGPVPDRIDISVRLDPHDGGLTDTANESTAVVRERVIAARAAAARRWHEIGVTTNARVPGPALCQQFPLSHAAAAVVESALRAGKISARAADQVVRVAWTLCDLRGATRPDTDDMTRALDLRLHTH
ncbi:YifB family Mg chelatase-like AAA ATPase [Nocardia sp. NPDC050710]|uniref:YifB family Mg chelatase-like AAA ATPase n=1 Tax=Nocardia sp. NPDC050710 TaxID=3157220 RepID=UPI0034057D19